MFIDTLVWLIVAVFLVATDISQGKRISRLQDRVNEMESSCTHCERRMQDDLTDRDLRRLSSSLS